MPHEIQTYSKMSPQSIQEITHLLFNFQMLGLSKAPFNWRLFWRNIDLFKVVLMMLRKENHGLAGMIYGLQTLFVGHPFLIQPKYSFYWTFYCSSCMLHSLLDCLPIKVISHIKIFTLWSFILWVEMWLEYYSIWMLLNIIKSVLLILNAFLRKEASSKL